MHAIYLTNEVNSSMVNYLFERFISGKTKIIYLNTNGGDLSIAFVIIDFISKSYAQDNDLTLIVSGRVMSAGMWIFYLSRCKKRILPATIGLAHRISSTLKVMTNGEGRNDDEYYRKRLEEVLDKKDTSLAEILGLKKKEKKAYLAGKDVRLEEGRLREILQQNLKKMKLPAEEVDWNV